MSRDALRTVWIHPSLRAEVQGKKRADSLRSGEIEHAFHYAGVRQAQLWLAVHGRHAPMFADAAFQTIYRDVFAALADCLAGRPVHLIGLGAGGGQKESWLLEALQGAGCRRRYTPVDVSLELALRSAEVAAGKADAEIVPVAGDLSLLADLPAWLERYPADEIRIYTAFGLTPNFLPSWLFPRLQAALRPQDVLLLSANLAPVPAESDAAETYRRACSAILPQYDNPETRQWLRQVLIDWGIAQHLSAPRFTLEIIENLLAFVARAEWLDDVVFPWEGESFEARKDDRLRLFFSLRYTADRLQETLNRYGLALGEGCVTPCRQEGVWRVRKTG